MKERELKERKFIDFNNDEWCGENESDDFRGGHVQWDGRFNLFSIFFNGTCIYTSKTFISTKKRLDNLMIKWNCKFLN